MKVIIFSTIFFLRYSTSLLNISDRKLRSWLNFLRFWIFKMQYWIFYPLLVSLALSGFWSISFRAFLNLFPLETYVRLLLGIPCTQISMRNCINNVEFSTSDLLGLNLKSDICLPIYHERRPVNWNNTTCCSQQISDVL